MLSNSSKLEGVGTESWKLLWSAAKEYSQKDAYLDDKKLYQHDRCVLCHQMLDEETKVRLQNFDTFITNELSQEAADAKKRYKIVLIPYQRILPKTRLLTDVYPLD